MKILTKYAQKLAGLTLLILLIIIISSIAPSKTTKNTITCQAINIIDGDTFLCKYNNQNLKVRLAQIDAPEAKQTYGMMSKHGLSQLILYKTVHLEIENNNQTDRYGRTVAEVYIGDQSINKKMVEMGMAWAYREYLQDNSYLDLENNARKKRLGLWQDIDPIYPSQFRMQKK